MPGGGLLISLSRRGGSARRRGAWWEGTILLGDRTKCTRGSGRSTKAPPARRQQGGRCFARPSKYGRGVLWLFTGPKRPTPGNANFFRAGSWRRRASLAGVAGVRRWRASLAGVAGGRRWRVSQAKPQKTRWFQLRELKHATPTNPQNKQRTTPSGGLARHTTAEHSREDTVD